MAVGLCNYKTDIKLRLPLDGCIDTSLILIMELWLILPVHFLAGLTICKIVAFLLDDGLVKRFSNFILPFFCLYLIVYSSLYFYPIYSNFPCSVATAFSIAFLPEFSPWPGVKNPDYCNPFYVHLSFRTQGVIKFLVQSLFNSLY
jgi:hypothetical protein